MSVSLEAGWQALTLKEVLHQGLNYYHHYLAFIEMGHFCPVSTSFQVSISLFVDLPAFCPPLGVNFKNIRGSLLHGTLFTWFVQFELYTFIFSITFNSLIISMFLYNLSNYNLNFSSLISYLMPITLIWFKLISPKC